MKPTNPEGGPLDGGEDGITQRHTGGLCHASLCDGGLNCVSSLLTRPPADVRELGSRHSASSGSVFRTAMGGRERGSKGEGGSLDQGVKLLQPSGQGWEKRNEGSRKERETESL